MNNTEQLKVAKSYLGRGGAIFRKFCGLGSRDPWCNAFVSYVFWKAGNAGLYCNGTKQTYCPNSIKWCYNNLACIPVFLAMPSDVIYFDWERNGTPNHIGFVRERKSCDDIYTIEGNTSGGIVANKVRTAKYVQAVFRPHFKATYKLGVIEIDGMFGYNSIANLQKALGISVDGILGQGTVKALQKRAGIKNCDGLWGNATSKAIQKMLGVKADGLFGKESVKALQKWINAQNSSPSSKPQVTPAPKPAPAPAKTTQDKICDWAKKIAADNSWHYVKWSSVKKTHECPICHKHPKGKYHGWNCTGFAFASWRHGGGIKCRCNCSVINDSEWNQILHAKTDAKALAIARKLIGINDIKVIRNGGKNIPQSWLKAGDICARANSKSVEHIWLYLGGGKMADCRGSNGKIPNDKQISVRKAQTCKIAIRYTGK